MCTQVGHHRSAWHVPRIIGNGLGMERWLYTCDVRSVYQVQIVDVCVCVCDAYVIASFSCTLLACIQMNCWIFHVSCGIYHLISCEKVICFVFYCNAKANNWVLRRKRHTHARKHKNCIGHAISSHTAHGHIFLVLQFTNGIVCAHYKQ